MTAIEAPAAGPGAVGRSPGGTAARPAGAAHATSAFADLLAAQLAGGGPAVVAAARPVTLGEMIALGTPAVLGRGVPAAWAGGVRAALPWPAGGVGTAVAAHPFSQAGAAGRAGAAGGQQSERVLAAARAYLGVPYRWGGTDPATGLDCSGFVQRAFADLGVTLPRVSADQARAGVPVAALADARPGDLVYWHGRGGRPNHIGIYLGAGRMIHAPRTGDVVREGPVRDRAPDAIRRVG